MEPPIYLMLATTSVVRIEVNVRDDSILTLMRWRDHGTFPGDCLTGLLEGNMRQFIAYADDDTLLELKGLWYWCENELAPTAWGDKAKTTRWALGIQMSIEHGRHDESKCATHLWEADHE